MSKDKMMKCGFKYCKLGGEVLKSESIKDGRYYHEECHLDKQNLTKIAELYQKYYNDKESWAIMMRSIYNWYKIHSSEYMLFVMSKCIRNKEKFKTFYSFYYKLNQHKYIEMYDKYKNKDEYYVFENVQISKIEYANLIKLMGKIKP